MDEDRDPGPDHERVLREIRESRPRFGCLGCVVSGGWALVGLAAFVVAVVYLVGRFT